MDACRNIGSILVLPFHACFHTEIVDLVEHFGPVDGLVAGDELCRFLNCPSHDLKLFNAVFHQFFLKIQGIYHEMRIGLVDCHFHNIGQRKTERL